MNRGGQDVIFHNHRAIKQHTVPIHTSNTWSQFRPAQWQFRPTLLMHARKTAPPPAYLNDRGSHPLCSGLLENLTQDTRSQRRGTRTQCSYPLHYTGGSSRALQDTSQVHCQRAVSGGQKLYMYMCVNVSRGSLPVTSLEQIYGMPRCSRGRGLGSIVHVAAR